MWLAGEAGMNPGAEGRCLGLRQACESGWTSSSGSDCLWESDRTWAECKERDEGGCVGAASEQGQEPWEPAAS